MKIKTKNISSINLDVIEKMTSRKSGRSLSHRYKDKMYRVGRNFNYYLEKKSEVLSYAIIEKFLLKLSKDLTPKTLYPRINGFRSLLLDQPFVKDLSPEERLEYRTDLWDLFKKRRASIDYSVYKKDEDQHNLSLGEEQINEILHYPSQRNRLFFRFMLCTGCSLREMVRVERDQITGSGKSSYSIDLSNQYNNQRKVYVGKKLLDEINKIFSGEKFLFETSTHQPMERAYIRRELKKLGSKLDPPVDLNSEVIQNTFAEKLKEQGYSESQIKQYMGKPVNKNVNERIDESIIRYISMC
jgi:integrase